jgi:predicted  nucleic acid-binding Zn-ribbon protein
MQSAKDMREALTAEVADKHDRILALRHEIQLLEERCRQADMQTHFKDDIIKEMRKDIKDARFKASTFQNILNQIYVI